MVPHLAKSVSFFILRISVIAFKFTKYTDREASYLTKHHNKKWVVITKLLLQAFILALTPFVKKSVSSSKNFEWQ